MIKLIFALFIGISSVSYANTLSFPINNDSMQKTMKKLSEKAPVDNIEISIFSNSISGSKLIMETDSCIKATEFLKPLVGDKPITINDGGYTVHINKRFVLDSSNYTLFSWMGRCSIKYGKSH